MIQPEEIDKELLELGKQYYNSVKKDFKKEKRHKRISIYFGILGLSIWVISTLLSIGGVTANEIILASQGVDNIYPFFTFLLDNYWLLYTITIIISVMIIIPIAYLGVFVNKLTIDKTNRISNLSFCYLFESIQDVRTYVINENNDNLGHAVGYLKIYLEIGGFNSGIAPNGNSLVSSHVALLLKEHKWIDIDKETRSILIMIQDFDDKIINRLNKPQNLEDIIDILESISIAEYLNTPSNKITNVVNRHNKEIEKYQANLLLKSAEKVSGLSKVEIEENSDKGNSIFTTLWNNINILFSGHNLLISFLSWYILTLSILVASSFLLTEIFSIDIDSKILIGVLTTPLLVATTITMTQYSKRQKENSISNSNISEE